ncbi:MAG: hypothetical protein IPL12_08290 [Bacteroidetes bacterium]|nr:hypothetical protein [Bacteroidota bacterium]
MKEELRKKNPTQNCVRGTIFEGIRIFSHLCNSDLERAILSRHNIIFIGLTRSGKTRIVRLLTSLLA